MTSTSCSPRAAKWRSVDSANSLTELIDEQPAQAALGRRVEFTLQRNDWRGGVELNLTSVRALPNGHSEFAFTLCRAGTASQSRSGSGRTDK